LRRRRDAKTKFKVSAQICSVSAAATISVDTWEAQWWRVVVTIYWRRWRWRWLGLMSINLFICFHIVQSMYVSNWIINAQKKSRHLRLLLYIHIQVHKRNSYIKVLEAALIKRERDNEKQSQVRNWEDSYWFWFAKRVGDMSTRPKLHGFQLRILLFTKTVSLILK